MAPKKPAKAQTPHWREGGGVGRDGLQGALFNLWTPNTKHRHHQPNTTHLDPTPPLEALAIAGNLFIWDCSSVDQVLWLGKVGLWGGDAAEALFADAPEVVPSDPPTYPYHPTFLSWSAPADVLAVMEVAEHSVLFFAGLVHQVEVTKDGNIDAEQEIHFAISGVAPPPPPSGQNTELSGDGHAPVTWGRMRTQYPLPHGPRLADHAVARGQHRPGVAQPQGHARRGVVDLLPV